MQQRGAHVKRVIAYKNQAPDPSTVEVPQALAQNRLDMAIFASPSSVHNFSNVCTATNENPSVTELLANVDIACIGPTTAQAVRDLDLTVALQPNESSIPALVRAIRDHYSRPNK